MKSPLNTASEAKLIRVYPCEQIIRLYQDELNIDVSNFFKNIPEVSLYECNDSKYRFYYPFSLEGDSKFYEILSTSSAEYYPGWKWENEIAKRYMSGSKKIIDIGCGDGAFLSEIKKEFSVDCYGIEFNNDAIKKCIEKGITVYNKPISQVAQEHTGAFDIASTFQVLEHISQVKDFIESKVKLVKEGGLIIIGVPYNNPYIFKIDKFHTLNLP